MKKKLLSILAVLSLVLLSGCGNNAKEENDVKEGTKVEDSAEGLVKDEDETLIVYSPNSEGLINSLIPAFEEKTGIAVQLEQAGTGELFTKLRGEASAPVADVIFGGSFQPMQKIKTYSKTMYQATIANFLKPSRTKMVIKQATPLTVL